LKFFRSIIEGHNPCLGIFHFMAFLWHLFWADRKKLVYIFIIGQECKKADD
jgi:hypothetical protein